MGRFFKKTKQIISSLFLITAASCPNVATLYSKHLIILLEGSILFPQVIALLSQLLIGLQNQNS